MEINFYNKEELENLSIFELRDAARAVGVQAPTTKKKEELIEEYLKIADGGEAQPSRRRGRPRGSKTIGRGPLKVAAPNTWPASSEVDKKILESATFFDDRGTPCKPPEIDPESVERKWGVLDVHSDGYGFLRAENCEYGSKDCYVPAKMIRSIGLRVGDKVIGLARRNNDNKPPALIAIITVNDGAPYRLKERPHFDDLVPVYPDERLKLENDKGNNDFAIRCIDLVAPIGKGQRAMIVSPPKAGKTTLLKKIANCISSNYPHVMLFVLLVDERPEEVTDMQRSINGEVIYSTFDEMPEHHCKSAELLIERAKRCVELKRDVVIIMDSLTRLARAYNLTIPPTGRTLSGGIDPGALYSPKRFFGSARNIEKGGSLTIIATALIDTGSRMDDVIYEEFKGTGNMEIHLDRKLSERRIFPAIDLNKSSTRREDLLLTPKELQGVYGMRRMMTGDSADATEQLLTMMMRTRSNDEFVDNILMNMRVIEKGGFQYTNTSGR